MTCIRFLSNVALFGGASLLLCVLSGHAQNSAAKIVPTLEPIAETKLLMEGLAHANVRGLERILNSQPEDEQSWKFARGQALLVAETANLLMLRPPKNQGELAWMERAMELRTLAAQTAQTVSKKDLKGSRAALVKVAASCNRCHDAFRVSVQIDVFAAPPPGKKLDVE